MPAAPPQEFRDDVVGVAHGGDLLIAEVANDFEISESCLRNWSKIADIEDGIRPGTIRQELDELRELKRRNRLLEQDKRGSASGGRPPLASEPQVGPNPECGTRWSLISPPTVSRGG